VVGVGEKIVDTQISWIHFDLWRGDLSPLECEALPCVLSVTPRPQVLRLLRNRTGWCGIPINPLTTGSSVATEEE